MAELRTVKVVHKAPESGWCLINKKDFNPETDELYEAPKAKKPATKKPETKKPASRKASTDKDD
jgi:hypothetical protein